DRACAGVHSVVHLASVNGTEFFYSKPETVLEVGIKGILNLIDATIRHGVSELVVASSSEVYQTPARIPTAEDAALSIPDPLNPRYSYAGAKIASELLALSYGRKHLGRVLIFRPHNVYGPDMGEEHVIPQLTLRLLGLAGGGPGPVDLPIQGTGRETRSFVYIDDLVDGVACILAKGEHQNIYHVGTQDEITIAALAVKIGAACGVAVRPVPSAPAAGGTTRRCPDISKLRRLGYAHPPREFRRARGGSDAAARVEKGRPRRRHRVERRDAARELPEGRQPRRRDRADRCRQDRGRARDPDHHRVLRFGRRR